MRSRWAIWISDNRGNRLKVGTGAGRFGIGRILNNKGRFYMDLPKSLSLDLMPFDGMVEFWRAPEGKRLKIVAIGFIKDRDRWSKARRISGPDQIDILDTRIIAYNAGTTYTTKTDNYDDMMKAVVRENLGSLAVDTARNLSGYNLTVELDTSKAPSGTLGFSRVRLLKALNKMSDASRGAGTELYYDLIPIVQDNQSIGFRFRTNINQLGQDRSHSANTPTFFGEDRGNLKDGHIREISSDEVNYVYVGGKGPEENRVVQPVSIPARIGLSPWNRREGFVSYNNSDDTNLLTAIGLGELSNKRPKSSFSGQLLDTPQAQLGVDWDFGWKVACDHDGDQFDALIRQIDIDVDNNKEDINARVEVVS